MHGVVLSGNGEIAVRLGAALILGSALGLNRELHGKPAGLRTHGLVSLGAAVAVIVSLGFPGDSKSIDPNAVSRVLQGKILWWSWPSNLSSHLAREFEKLREGFMPSSLVIINLWTSKLFQFRLDLYSCR